MNEPRIPNTLIPRRVRHPLRFRLLTVQSVTRPSPHLIRIRFADASLTDFISEGFDDHVKLFFPDPHTGTLRLPEAGPEGPVFPEGQRPLMRDYTPRRFDAAAGVLDLEFVVHAAGPATEWALRAAPGQQLGIGGPRGSYVVPTANATHVLIGDDTAIPAISRRLEELPAGTQAQVIIEVDAPEDELALATQAELELHWVFRNGAEPGTSAALVDTLRMLHLAQPQDTYAWVACESAQARALRQLLQELHGVPARQVKAAGYWRRGAVAVHDHHDD